MIKMARMKLEFCYERTRSSCKRFDTGTSSHTMAGGGVAAWKCEPGQLLAKAWHDPRSSNHISLSFITRCLP